MDAVTVLARGPGTCGVLVGVVDGAPDRLPALLLDGFRSLSGIAL